MKINKIAIIGIGLIGGSLARALRDTNFVSEIIAYDHKQENLNAAFSLGIIDSFTHKISEVVENADIVFLSVPLGAMRNIFNLMKGYLSKETIVTDSGSVKASVVEDCKAVFGEIPINFVPGHPIAGTEKNGVLASFATLYDKNQVILTPINNITNETAIKKVRAMWHACGAKVTQLTIEDHDKILAATSHLPHMLAVTLVNLLTQMDDSADKDYSFYTASGFLDLTRIASSSPTMWRDICLSNKEKISTLVNNYANEMHKLARLIYNGEKEHLTELFKQAKRARDRL